MSIKNIIFCQTLFQYINMILKVEINLIWISSFHYFYLIFWRSSILLVNDKACNYELSEWKCHYIHLLPSHNYIFVWHSFCSCGRDLLRCGKFNSHLFFPLLHMVKDLGCKELKTAVRNKSLEQYFEFTAFSLNY